MEYPNTLVYMNEGNNNFGDIINIIFFELLSGKKFEIRQVCELANMGSKSHFLGFGSILTYANKNSVVLGTGFISKDARIKEKPASIISVRGPKTRQILINQGYECPEIYGDPVILFPLIYQSPKCTISNKIGFLPHYVDVDICKNTIVKYEEKGYSCKLINIKCGLNYKQLVDDIAECETIITSTLHGLIMSVIYKKKVIYTQFTNKVCGGDFKFNDFLESINTTYTLLKYTDDNLINNLINYDKNALKNIGVSMIDAYPFIETDKKNILKNKWINYWNDL